eukprot:815554-Pyramimonas_sp.AAC.1
MGVRDACGHTHWDLRRSSPWGHGACEGCAEMGDDDDDDDDADDDDDDGRREEEGGPVWIRGE